MHCTHTPPLAPHVRWRQQTWVETGEFPAHSTHEVLHSAAAESWTWSSFACYTLQGRYLFSLHMYGNLIRRCYKSVPQAARTSLQFTRVAP